MEARENGDALNLESIQQAAEAALCNKVEGASDAILRAANEMPHDASDFDCGLAAGFALARYLEQVAQAD